MARWAREKRIRRSLRDGRSDRKVTSDTSGTGDVSWGFGCARRGRYPSLARRTTASGTTRECDGFRVLVHRYGGGNAAHASAEIVADDEADRVIAGRKIESFTVAESFFAELRQLCVGK